MALLKKLKAFGIGGQQLEKTATLTRTNSQSQENGEIQPRENSYRGKSDEFLEQ